MLKEKKEKIIFIGVAVLSAILILCTALIGTKKFYPVEVESHKTQILFLGDSNIAYDFEGKDIPELVYDRLGVTTYNGAIGGTSAAKINTENYFDDRGDMFCLYNITKVMESGDHNAVADYYGTGSQREKEAVGKVMMLTDLRLEEVDYIVLSYGLNDYTTGRPIYAEDPYAEYTYAGALRAAVERLQKLCPNAKIILSSITYCAFMEGGEVVMDGYERNWGGGTIEEYRDAMKLVSSEYENVYFMDNLEYLGIGRDNYEQYLRDEMHLNEAGREIYVDYLEETINGIEGKL